LPDFRSTATKDGALGILDLARLGVKGVPGSDEDQVADDQRRARRSLEGLDPQVLFHVQDPDELAVLDGTADKFRPIADVIDKISIDTRRGGQPGKRPIFRLFAGQLFVHRLPEELPVLSRETHQDAAIPDNGRIAGLRIIGSDENSASADRRIPERLIADLSNPAGIFRAERRGQTLLDGNPVPVGAAAEHGPVVPVHGERAENGERDQGAERESHLPPRQTRWVKVFR